MPSQDEVAAILDATGVTGAERDEIIESARDTSGSAWLGTDLPEQTVQLAALLDVEQMTTNYVEWSPLIIPGLLQVSSYARAIVRAARVPDAEVGTRVAVRMGRKDILTRRNPTRCTALIGESALRQMIGGPEVVAEQLDYLVSLSDRPNIEIRVVALSPEQSTELIRSEAERIARIDDSAVEEVDQERG